jgi:L-lysine exporter family protein LysE/ArgO
MTFLFIREKPIFVFFENWGKDILALLAGTVIGIILAIPPGPIVMMGMNLALGSDMKLDFKFALGTSVMDIFYCLAAVFAASAAHAAVQGFSDDHPELVLVFQALVVVGLIIIGIFLSLGKYKNHPAKESFSNVKANRFLDNLKSKGPFFLGMAIALGNIANPTFLTALAVMASQAKKLGAIQVLPWDNLLYSLGFGIGNFIWIVFITELIHYHKAKFSHTMVKRLVQISGIVFILAGILLAYHIVESKIQGDLGQNGNSSGISLPGATLFD